MLIDIYAYIECGQLLTAKYDNPFEPRMRNNGDGNAIENIHRQHIEFLGVNAFTI